MEKDLSLIVEPLLSWYGKNKRDLPWRHTRDPYCIWLSEIMLQQTRVDTVIEYYLRFLKELPTVEDLAACSEQKLLKLWEGLGYYSRARNLARAARKIAEKGVFPASAAEIAELPGVGEYTAGAIASIAFGQPEPAVDGNVLRVVSRVAGDCSNIDLPATKKAYAANLCAIYPEGRCGDFTQSLMELGALICVPNGAPKCGQCPLNALCEAHRSGTEERMPVRAEKRPRRSEKRTVLLLVSGARVGILRRSGAGLLKGLWAFPDLEGHADELDVIAALKNRGIAAAVTARGEGKHVFTHVEWHMKLLKLRCDALPPELTAVTAEELDETYPLPTAFKAARALLRQTDREER